MQKSGVQTLSIIDTLSQVVKEEPGQLLQQENNNNNSSSSKKGNVGNGQPPQLQKRSPKVAY